MRRATMNRVGTALALCLFGSAPVWAAITGGVNPDPMDGQSVQTIKVFVNGSGGTLTSGTVVIQFLTDANIVTGAIKGASTNLGLRVTTTTSASSRLAVGVVHDDSCADQNVCRVTVYGPELTRFACATSNVTDVGTTVGTSTVAGRAGSGSRLGFLASQTVLANDTSDTCSKWVFVNPSPN